MPVAIVGVNGAMAPGTVITSQNPVDGETLDAASNNTAMQTLSNYIKSLAEKYMDLATLQTATAAKAFAAGVFAGGGTLGVGLAAYLDGRGTGSAPGVSGAADDNVAGVGVRGWGGLITANVNALALALYRGANLATPDNTYVGVVGRIWGALAFGTSGTSAPSPGGTVALQNTITPGLLVKAMGTILVNGAGAITPAVAQNVTSVTAVAGAAGYIRVVLAQTFLAAGSTHKYLPWATWLGLPATAGAHLATSCVNATTFDITLWNGGTQLDPTLVAYEIGFGALGFQ